MLALISLLELLIIELYTLWKKTSITHDWLIFAHTERRQVFFVELLKAIRIRLSIEPAETRRTNWLSEKFEHNGLTYVSVQRNRFQVTRLAINLSLVGVN